MPTVCQQQEAEEEEGCHSYCYLCKCSTALPLATGTRCSPLDACPCCCPLCCCCCCCTVSLITAIRAKECSKGGGSSPSSLMGCTIVLIAQMTRRSMQQGRQSRQQAVTLSPGWQWSACMNILIKWGNTSTPTHSQACQTVCSTVRPSGNLSPHGLVQFLHCQHMCRPCLPLSPLLYPTQVSSVWHWAKFQSQSTRFDPLHSFRFIHSLKSNLHNLTWWLRLFLLPVRRTPTSPTLQPGSTSVIVVVLPPVLPPFPAFSKSSPHLPPHASSFAYIFSQFVSLTLAQSVSCSVSPSVSCSVSQSVSHSVNSSLSFAFITCFCAVYTHLICHPHSPDLTRFSLHIIRQPAKERGMYRGREWERVGVGKNWRWWILALTQKTSALSVHQKKPACLPDWLWSAF